MEIPSSKVVDLVAHEDARTFIGALTDIQLVFSGKRLGFGRELLYRGQSSAEWSLLPSALRHTPSWMTNSFAWVQTPFESNFEQVLCEFESLRVFFEESDNQGLVLPGDGQDLRQAFDGRRTSLLDSKHESWNREWPHNVFLSLLALAQHSGIPTRLLDWSRDPFTAAYFAAVDFLNHRNSVATDRLMVCALVTPLIKKTIEFPEDKDTRPFIKFITAPSADNPNLRAQRGAFTLHNQVGLSIDYPDRTSLEDVLAQLWQLEPRDDVPPLWKITLPVSEAKPLLSMLDGLGYNKARLFPGFEGVAGTLQERRLLAVRGAIPGILATALGTLPPCDTARVTRQACKFVHGEFSSSLKGDSAIQKDQNRALLPVTEFSRRSCT